jgi:hypothetical protein
VEDDEHEEEDEEHYLRRVARPRAAVPTRTIQQHLGIVCTSHCLSTHAAPSMLLLGSGGGGGGAAPTVTLPPTASQCTPPRFPALVKPPHIATMPAKGHTTTTNILSGASTPLSHYQKVAAEQNGGVEVGTPTGRRHRELDSVDLDGIVPKVRALLARQDTLRTMLLTLDSKSDGALYMSVNAELRGNEGEVRALRHEMHQLRRAAAASGHAVSSSSHHPHPTALQPIPRRL